MRDNQSVMLQFVKIMERHPEIYNTTLDTYRMRSAVDKAWESIAESVRNEIQEECTIDEIKAKWKGIRSSFSRYKCRLSQSNYDSSPCRTYYLYDSLKFLEPFSKLKSVPVRKEIKTIFDSASQCVALDNETSVDYEQQSDEDYEQLQDIKPVIDCNENDIKLELIKATDNSMESEQDICGPSQSKRTKSDMSEHNAVNGNEDMEFFRSILPDIKNFTTKEKRKLKIGILKLIDDIDNERRD